MSAHNQARIIGLIILILVVTYNYFYFHPNLTTALSEALAGTAGYLLSLSFLLTSLSYFFNYLDSGLQLRKDLGVMALWLAFYYSLTLMFRFPDTYFWGLPNNITNPEVLLGMGGLTILFIMRLNGAKIGIRVVPQKLWRPVFRLGYIALLMFITRAMLTEWSTWTEFWNSQQLLPPPRLILSVFASLTITLRLIMGTHMLFFKRNSPPLHL